MVSCRVLDWFLDVIHNHCYNAFLRRFEFTTNTIEMKSSISY